MSKYDITSDLHFTNCIMKDNTEFLSTNTKAGFDEIIAFIDDSWNFLGPFVEKEKWAKYYTQYAMMYFGSHVLFPLSLAIKIDLQVGNTPACFFELRMILESMAKCYWADIKYKEQDYFMDKLIALDEEMKEKKTSTSKLLSAMGHDYCALWGELSNMWLHSKGFVRRISNHTLEKDGIPGYALGSPMPYMEGDIDTINELCSQVSRFRTMLKETSLKWRKELKL